VPAVSIRIAFIFCFVLWAGVLDAVHPEPRELVIF